MLSGVPNIATLREHTANISGILRAGWVAYQFHTNFFHLINIFFLRTVLFQQSLFLNFNHSFFFKTVFSF